MILFPIQAFGDGYGFYLNKTRFPLKRIAGMTKKWSFARGSLYVIISATIFSYAVLPVEW
jgi:hypothetical protein